jgi:hypothetical protein
VLNSTSDIVKESATRLRNDALAKVWVALFASRLINEFNLKVRITF